MLHISNILQLENIQICIEEIKLLLSLSFRNFLNFSLSESQFGSKFDKFQIFRKISALFVHVRSSWNFWNYFAKNKCTKTTAGNIMNFS